MRATSVEKREQIISAKLRGEKASAIVLWTKVSLSTVYKVWERYQKTGSYLAIRHKGKKTRITFEIESKIRQEIALNSDITLEEMIAKLDLPIKKSRLSKLLILWGLSFKKTLHPNGQKREDVQERRKNWKQYQETLDISKLKFLDESSINCGMTRLYGRAAKNERVNDYVPDVRFERTSIISILGIDGVSAPMMFKGTLNGDFFAGYIQQVLAPALCSGDIVIMDNYSAHKVAGILDSIYKKGASVVFLPPYSPDLNPIELMWSKVKSILRKLKPRTFEELLNVMAQALDSVSKNDILGWFKNNGYRVNV